LPYLLSSPFPFSLPLHLLQFFLFPSSLF
jgi:hypothetical protein